MTAKTGRSGKRGVVMKRMDLKKRRNVAGWLFILPWAVGALMFFIQPVVRFFAFSFFRFRISAEVGYELLPLEDGIFQNYIDAWASDTTYPQAFVGAFEVFAYEVPIIVFFSLFMALLLSQDFRGRGVMRTIFFLPIVVTSGAMAVVIARGVSRVDMGMTDGAASLYDVTRLTDLLMSSGFPQRLVTAVTTVVARVADLVWKSGVQILIFLIGLLSIPDQYYEAAKVEGATGWETFWKITFPVVSPYLLANAVYTLIVESVAAENGVIARILTIATQNYDYSAASAMLWMYVLAILLIVVLLFAVTRRRVFRAG